MFSLLSIDTIVFTILGYPMSYLELAGTVCNLWCVWLVTRRNILSWPVGLVGVVLFAVLFWQIQLYADVLEQLYYFVTGVWGWMLWRRVRTAREDGAVSVTRLSSRARVAWVFGIAVLTLVVWFVLMHIHTWLPTIVTVPASMPFLDACTTVMSLAAQVLLMRRVVENWVLWIMVDILAIGLYATKGVLLVSVLYGIFLVLASKGLWDWVRAYRAREQVSVARNVV